MTVMIREFRATYAFVERNANLVKRYWSWELVWMAYSIANSLSVSFIGLGMEQIAGGRTWTAASWCSTWWSARWSGATCR